MCTNLQANLQVELTSTGDDVLTGLGNPGLDTGVGLGETLETLDKLGEIGGVLDLDGDLDDGGDGELHDPHVVRGLGGGEGTALEEELVNADETDNITCRAVLEWLDVSAHHENSSLNRLDKQVLLLTRDVVRTLNSNLGTSLDGTREDTAEGVESTLLRRRHHLGDVQNEGCLGIAVADTHGGLVVHRALVQSLDAVALCSYWGGQVDDNHLEQGVTGGQELLHDDLEERLALEVLLVLLEDNVELFEHGAERVLLEVHGGIKDADDGVQNEHAADHQL